MKADLALEAGMDGGALDTLRRVGGEEREEQRGEGEEEISQGGEEGRSRHRLPARGLHMENTLVLSMNVRQEAKGRR